MKPAKGAVKAKAPTKRAPAKKKAVTPRRPSRRSKQATDAEAKRIADAAAKAAKGAGATGRRLGSAKQQLRDSMIVARKAQGLSNAMIASEARVTERTVERVLADRRGVRSPLDESPMQLLEELAVGFRLAIGDYEAMALAWFETNQTAALGAKKAADETRIRLAAFLSDVGKLPSNLELFRSEAEMQRIAEEMVRTMQAVAAGEMDASEAVEVFRRLAARRAEQQAQLPAETS